MREALFYERIGGNSVKCNLCAHRCKILESKRGICGVRENNGGMLYTLVYDRVVSRMVDPIEKKPLFHFFPGSSSYSVATVGCNFRCLNCQNYDISQMPRDLKGKIVGEKVTPDEIVEDARRYGCQSIAYTYTEPTIFFELAYDTAKLAKKQGIRNVFVTNGYMTEEALKEISPYLDAAHIDLKSFDDAFYRRVCGARLQPVLDSVRLHKELGIWIEIVTLIIPNLNDGEANLRKIAEFIVDVDRGIPWHVSRFYPTYKLLDQPATPVPTLRLATKIGKDAGLRHVYQGNVPGEGEDTYCYNCGELVVRRVGYQILENRITNSSCPRCGVRVEGVWS